MHPEKKYLAESTSLCYSGDRPIVTRKHTQMVERKLRALQCFAAISKKIKEAGFPVESEHSNFPPKLSKAELPVKPHSNIETAESGKDGLGTRARSTERLYTPHVFSLEVAPACLSKTLTNMCCNCNSLVSALREKAKPEAASACKGAGQRVEQSKF